MTWEEAVNAMLAGHQVRRASEAATLVLSETGVSVAECGVEPCILAAAWTHRNEPVRVFQGAWSRQLFVPDTEDTQATDWQVWK